MAVAGAGVFPWLGSRDGHDDAAAAAGGVSEAWYNAVDTSPEYQVGYEILCMASRYQSAYASASTNSPDAWKWTVFNYGLQAAQVVVTVLAQAALASSIKGMTSQILQGQTAPLTAGGEGATMALVNAAPVATGTAITSVAGASVAKTVALNIVKSMVTRFVVMPAITSVLTSAGVPPELAGIVAQAIWVGLQTVMQVVTIAQQQRALKAFIKDGMAYIAQKARQLPSQLLAEVYARSQAMADVLPAEYRLTQGDVVRIAMAYELLGAEAIGRVAAGKQGSVQQALYAIAYAYRMADFYDGYVEAMAAGRERQFMADQGLVIPSNVDIARFAGAGVVGDMLAEHLGRWFVAAVDMSRVLPETLRSGTMSEIVAGTYFQSLLGAAGAGIGIELVGQSGSVLDWNDVSRMSPDGFLSLVYDGAGIRVIDVQAPTPVVATPGSMTTALAVIERPRAYLVDTSAPVRLVDFPGLEAMLAVGGQAMRSLYSQRIMGYLLDNYRRNPDGLPWYDLNSEAFRDSLRVAGEALIEVHHGYVSVDITHRYITYSQLFSGGDEMNGGWVIVDAQSRLPFEIARVSERIGRTDLQIVQDAIATGILVDDPRKPSNALDLYMPYLGGDIDAKGFMVSNSRQREYPRNLQGLMEAWVGELGNPSLITKFRLAIFKQYIDARAAGNTKETARALALAIKVGLFDWMAKSGNNLFAELLGTDKRSGRDLTRAFKQFITRDLSKGRVKIVEGAFVQTRGNLQLGERYAAAEWARDLGIAVSRALPLPAGMTRSAVEQMFDDTFTLALTLDEDMALQSGGFFTQQSHSLSLIGAMIDLLYGKTDQLATIMQVNTKNYGITNPPLNAFMVQRTRATSLGGAYLTALGQLGMESGQATRISGPAGLIHAVESSIEGLTWRPLAKLYNPFAISDPSAEDYTTIDGMFTGTRKVGFDRVPVSVLEEFKLIPNLWGGGTDLLDSTYTSMLSAVFSRETFDESYMLITTDSSNTNARNPADRGHLKGYTEFSTKAILDPRFGIEVDAATGLAKKIAGQGNSYQATSTYGLKPDGYRQNLLRKYIMAYLVDHAAKKTTISVRMMLDAIVNDHGRELGVSRVEDVAPGTGWRQGILAPGKLQVAITREFSTMTNSYDLVKGANGKIDYDQLNENEGVVKIFDTMMLDQFEQLPELHTSGRFDLNKLDGFNFEKRGYILRLLELDVDRMVIWSLLKRFNLLECTWAGVPDELANYTP